MTTKTLNLLIVCFAISVLFSRTACAWEDLGTLKEKPYPAIDLKNCTYRLVYRNTSVSSGVMYLETTRHYEFPSDAPLAMQTLEFTVDPLSVLGLQPSLKGPNALRYFENMRDNLRRPVRAAITVDTLPKENQKARFVFSSFDPNLDPKYPNNKSDIKLAHVIVDIIPEHFLLQRSCLGKIPKN